jgi:hypothetical protein
MGFSVAGHSGQNHKKADLSLNKNFFENFQSRFGFLVQFYPYPELEIKKYAQGARITNFWSFLKNWPTGHGSKIKILLNMALLNLINRPGYQNTKFSYFV